jgi:hypothetical protein
MEWSALDEIEPLLRESERPRLVCSPNDQRMPGSAGQAKWRQFDIGRVGHGSRRSLAPAPLMLLREHGAQLAEPVWTVLEAPENRFTVRDAQRDDLALRVVGMLQDVGRVEEAAVAKKASQLEDEPVGNGDAGRAASPAIISRTSVRVEET